MIYSEYNKEYRSNNLKKILIPFFLLFSVNLLFSTPKGVEFSIRFFDKKIYFPYSKITIKLEITNNSPDEFRFKLSESRVFNLDFDVRTLTNQKLPCSRQYITQINQNQPVFFRELSLHPGEQYSFFAHLNEYVTITEPGVYIVKALFYPELKTRTKTTPVESNLLNLHIRPSVGVREIQWQIDEETGEVLKQQPLPPDEVVRYTIEARQKSQWNKFFLYLDVESLLQKDPARRRRYLLSSEEERMRMLDEFKENLMRQRVEGDILLIPQEFEIIKTEYTPDEGRVQVMQKFAYPDYTEVKRYTYYLQKRDRVWFIYDYEVVNIGTE